MFYVLVTKKYGLIFKIKSIFDNGVARNLVGGESKRKNFLT